LAGRAADTLDLEITALAQDIEANKTYRPEHQEGPPEITCGTPAQFEYQV